MCCKDITDIYQLLKASGTCKENLSCYNLPVFDIGPLAESSSSSSASSADENTEQSNQCLIFKKWHDIHPGTEFRCFVRNKKLIGISPRDWPQYHDYICTQRINIINDITSIFKEHIKPKFPLYDCKSMIYISFDLWHNISSLIFAMFSFRYIRCSPRCEGTRFLNGLFTIQSKIYRSIGIRMGGIIGWSWGNEMKWII